MQHTNCCYLLFEIYFQNALWCRHCCYTLFDIVCGVYIAVTHCWNTVWCIHCCYTLFEHCLVSTLLLHTVGTLCGVYIAVTHCWNTVWSHITVCACSLGWQCRAKEREVSTSSTSCCWGRTHSCLVSTFHSAGLVHHMFAAWHFLCSLFLGLLLGPFLVDHFWWVIINGPFFMDHDVPFLMNHWLWTILDEPFLMGHS